MPITLAYTETDAALAERIAADLSDIRTKGERDVLIVLISPTAAADADVLRQIDAALSRGQTIVPVLAADTPLPTAIAGLTPADFRGGAYPLQQLRQRLLDQHEAEPNLRKRNRRAGLVVGLIALAMFGVGLYGVGVLGIRAPREEFDAVETQRMNQRNTLIAPTLEPLIPVGQFAISQFHLTVTAVPTRLREYLVQTVTATSQGTFIPSLTPRPTEE